MKVVARTAIKINNVEIPEGTEGMITPLTEAPEIQAEFETMQPTKDGSYYIVRFPSGTGIVHVSQLLKSNELVPD